MKAALPLVLAVLGNVLYHSSQKLTSHHVNPFLTLAASFALASGLSLGLYFATWRIVGGAGGLSWTAAGLGLALVIIEASFLYAYRLGWPVGVTAVAVTVSQTLLLLPLGYMLFAERYTAGALIGAALGLIGLTLVCLQASPR